VRGAVLFIESELLIKGERADTGAAQKVRATSYGIGVITAI